MARTVVYHCDSCDMIVAERIIKTIYIQRGTSLSGYGNSNRSQVLELCLGCRLKMCAQFPVLAVMVGPDE